MARRERLTEALSSLRTCGAPPHRAERRRKAEHMGREQVSMGGDRVPGRAMRVVKRAEGPAPNAGSKVLHFRIDDFKRAGEGDTEPSDDGREACFRLRAVIELQSGKRPEVFQDGFQLDFFVEIPETLLDN